MVVGGRRAVCAYICRVCAVELFDVLAVEQTLEWGYDEYVFPC